MSSPQSYNWWFLLWPMGTALVAASSWIGVASRRTSTTYIFEFEQEPQCKNKDKTFLAGSFNGEVAQKAIIVKLL